MESRLELKILELYCYSSNLLDLSIPPLKLHHIWGFGRGDLDLYFHQRDLYFINILSGSLWGDLEATLRVKLRGYILGASNLVVDVCPKLCVKVPVATSRQPLSGAWARPLWRCSQENRVSLRGVGWPSWHHTPPNVDVLPFTRKELRESYHRLSVCSTSVTSILSPPLLLVSCIVACILSYRWIHIVAYLENLPLCQA